MNAYFYCNDILNRNNLADAGHFLKIYRIVDPNNADMYYMWADYYARTNDYEKSLYMLNMAAKNGFYDIEKINSTPSFHSLADKKEFEEATLLIENNNL